MTNMKPFCLILSFATERDESEGGLGAYSPEAYAEYDMAEYRVRFPDETAALTDEQIFHVVSNQDDELEDDQWRIAFGAASDNR